MWLQVVYNIARIINQYGNYSNLIAKQPFTNPSNVRPILDISNLKIITEEIIAQKQNHLIILSWKNNGKLPASLLSQKLCGFNIPYPETNTFPKVTLTTFWCFYC